MGYVSERGNQPVEKFCELAITKYNTTDIMLSTLELYMYTITFPFQIDTCAY